MDDLKIDQAMIEENKINRFLNTLAIQYDGNLARQFELYYLKKCKRINELEDNWNKLKQWCIESRDAERKEKWNLVKLDKDLEPIIENDIRLYNKMLTVMRDLESKGE